MRYLLQERFIGACLGSVMAQRLSYQATTSLNQPQTKQIFWLEIQQKVLTQIPLDSSQSLSWENLSIDSGEKITISELAQVFFPVVLYYHDNLRQLALFWQQTAQYWQIPASDLDGILWWSTAISLVLREKLNPEELPQQLTVTDPNFKQSLGQDLVSLESIFNHGLSITEVAAELSSIANLSDLPFLLSLYCFHQTPENFALTIQQAMIVKQINPHIVALTGFLSGAYNSRIGLPVHYYKFCQKGDDYKKSWQLGRKVFALWSGVYDLGNDVNIAAIIATPRTLQNRSHLKIISQKEYESN